MLLLTCPSCGVTAEETEFAPGGQAHIRRMGPGSDDAAFADYLFERKNPRGRAPRALAARLRLRQVVQPRPRHPDPRGLRRLSRPRPEPPEAVVAAIRARHPGWEFGA